MPDRNTEEASTPFDDSHWSFEDDEPTAPRRRRPVLLLAAGLPWLVLAVLMLRGSGGVSQDATPLAAPAPSPSAGASAEASIEPTTDATTDPASPADGAGQPSEDPTTATLITSQARDTATIADATALAVPIARAWLTDVPPRLDLGIGQADDTGYVEHLGAESVDFPAPGQLVVSLVAVLLHAEGDQYTSVEVRRLAVPLTVDRYGARPAGSPWWLPDPDLRVDAPSTTPVDDPEVLAQAGAALEEAGYRDVGVTSLARSDGWAWIVTATAVAPSGSAPAEHTVWLRPHLGRLVVSGWLPTTGDGPNGRVATEEPSAQPSPDEAGTGTETETETGEGTR